MTTFFTERDVQLPPCMIARRRMRDNQQLSLLNCSTPSRWKILALTAVILLNDAFVLEAAAAKMPELPRLSRRQLLHEHDRLRKLGKALRPDLPRNFHDLTYNGVPVIKVYNDENHPFDGLESGDNYLAVVDKNTTHDVDDPSRKMQQYDGNARPLIYYRYPVGSSVPLLPIRFKFVTDPLMKRMGQSNATDETISYIIDTILPKVESVWDSYLGVHQLPAVVELDQGYCFGFFANDLASQSIYSDVDLVLIISGYNVLTSGTGEQYDVCSDNSLVVGSYCAVEEYGRPIIGFLNFCLNETTSISTRRLQSVTPLIIDLEDPWRTNPPIAEEVNVLTDRDLTTAAIHQLGHVLGVQVDIMKLFLNKTFASPYTPQPAPMVNIPCRDGTLRHVVFPANNTIQANQRSDGLITYQFTLPYTQSVAQNHFNCPSLAGALLEANPATPSCVGSHLNGRVFFGELMQHLAAGSFYSVSPMTLSILYDSFWYLPFYKEDLLPYGVAAGCEFASGAACIVNDTIPSFGKGFYCTNPIVVEPNGTISLDQNDILCDPFHQKWALCDLFNLSQVPSGFMSNSSSAQRWFSDKNLVSMTSEVDFCPMPIVTLPIDCNDSSTSLGLHYQGEVYGKTSRCINAALSSKRSVPACFSVACDDKNFRVVVNGISCKYDGEIHSVQTMDNKNATFECPRFATICPQLASCPSDCGGSGVCDYSVKPPKCICYNGVTSDNCQNPLANTFAPSPYHAAAPITAPKPAPASVTSAAPRCKVCHSALIGLMVAIATFRW